MGSGAPDEAAAATGVAPRAADASATLGTFSVVPAITAESSDRPLAAAKARVVKLLAAANDHRVSPGWTTWGTDAAAGLAATAMNMSEIRTVRMAFTVPRHAAHHKPTRRITGPCRSAVGHARAGLAGSQQALAQLGLLLGRGVPLRHGGQVVHSAQPEELQKARRRAIEHGAELRAPRLLDEPALEQRRGRRLRGDAADARHLGPRHGLQVGDDGQRLGLRRGQRWGARPGQQPPRGL